MNSTMNTNPQGNYENKQSHVTAWQAKSLPKSPSEIFSFSPQFSLAKAKQYTLYSLGIKQGVP